MGGEPDIPILLRTILRDATHYFLLLFSASSLSTLFLFVAPVGGITYYPRCAHRAYVFRLISNSCQGCELFFFSTQKRS